MNQDMIAVNAIELYGAGEDARTGNMAGIDKKLKKVWTSLPSGADTHTTLSEVKKRFRHFFVAELNGKTILATPQGQLAPPVVAPIQTKKSK